MKAETMGRKAETPRTKLIRQVKTLLADNIIDVEIEKDDINSCIDFALERYRQRADNATEEAMVFLELKEGKSEYTLPDNVIDVRQIHRRGIGGAVSNSSTQQFDAFDLAFTNFYLLQAGGTSGLYSWELYNQYLETASMMFGGDYNYIYDTRTKKLTIIRDQRLVETVAMQAHLSVTDDLLITGTYCGPWLRSYAVAEAKIILGLAYSKFSSLPTPGGTTLPGAELKAEGLAEKETLEEELRQYVDGSDPLSWILG